MKKNIHLLLLGAISIFTLLASCAESTSNKKDDIAIENRIVTEVTKTETIIKKQDKILSNKEGAIEHTIVDDSIELESVIVKKEELLEVSTSSSTKPTKNIVVEEPILVVDPDIEEEEIAILKMDHSIWDKLLKKNVSSTGKVNYSGFKTDKAQIQQYISLLTSNAPTSEWSKNEKLAYWINVYNVFTVKLIVDNYPLKSITNLDKPWDKKFISIQGKSYSLGDVENNILRKMGESRIHFAINCASVSCPKLLNEAFTAEKLSSQLRLVTKSFFSDKTKNQLIDGDLKLSKLFEWYATDFSKGNVIAYINKYSGKTVGLKSKFSFLEYNWNLNE